MNKKIVGLITALLLIPAALAVSSSYYAKTTVYFNIPSDASFSIAMPSDYTSFTSITGTDEGGATATDWISFNFTDIPQATLQEPYQLGASANTQQGTKKPIFYIDPTGNVDMKFEIKMENPPDGVETWFNASCSGTCSGATATTDLTKSDGDYQQLVDTIANTDYLNTSVYANVSAGTAAGVTSKTFYIKSTAV